MRKRRISDEAWEERYRKQSELLRSKDPNLTDEEVKSLYTKLSDKNPNTGKVIDILDISQVSITNNSRRRFKWLIPSWMSNDDKNIYLSQHKFTRKLNELGLTTQYYYDIMVLGLSSPEQRQKCKCGNDARFTTMTVGYGTYCCQDCKRRYQGANQNFIQAGIKASREHHWIVTDYHKQQISKVHKGKKVVVSEKTREKLSKIMKGRKITWRDKQREAALKRIDRDPDSVLKILKSRGKRGIYKPEKSDKEMRYLSSWELKFMKICDLSKDVVKMESTIPIPYTYSGKDHRYIPDFKLTLDTGIVLIVEIKPKQLVNDPIVIAKRIVAKKYCKQNGYKYVTLTEIELFKRIHGSFNIYDYVV